MSQEQFTQLMGINPSSHSNSPNRAIVKNLPLESMTFQQAMDFCDKLTKMDSAGELLSSDWHYTLPTVEQWVFYAAETQPTEAYAHFERRDRETVPLGTLAPNGAGLYDVLGDVYELTRTPWTVAGKPGHVRRGGWFKSITKDLDAVITDPARFENTWWYPDDPTEPSLPGPESTGFRVILVPAAGN